MNPRRLAPLGDRATQGSARRMLLGRVVARLEARPCLGPLESVDALEPLLGLVREESAQQREGGRRRADALEEGVGRLVDDGREEAALARVVPKRRLAHEHLEEDAADGPIVDRRAVALWQQADGLPQREARELGRKVLVRALHGEEIRRRVATADGRGLQAGRCLARRRTQLREAEVGDAHLHKAGR